MPYKTIKIAFEIKGKPTVLAVEAEIFGALAVHPTPRERAFWTVTHVQSGRAIFRFFNSNETAKRIAMKLGAHPGWTRGVEEIESDEKMKTIVNKAMRRLEVVER